MTRPMPEPPECTCMSRGNGCYTCLDTIGWDTEEDCPGCPVHAGPSYPEHKRLTGAECAAEYWRAEADHTGIRNGEGVGWSSAEVAAALEHEVEVWHRFATHPHADLNGDTDD